MPRKLSAIALTLVASVILVTVGSATANAQTDPGNPPPDQVSMF